MGLVVDNMILGGVFLALRFPLPIFIKPIAPRSSFILPSIIHDLDKESVIN
jgi:hypothetical protein